MQRTVTEPNLQTTGARIAHGLALAAVVFTWPLLMVGGFVSVYRLGMAVPDWPTTFGLNMFYYNLFEAPRGVFAEHAHRLYASLVGLSCLVLVLYFSVTRLGLKGLGLWLAAALAALVAAVNPAVSQAGVSGFVAGLGTLGVMSAAVAVWAFLKRRDFALGLAWLALAAVVLQGAIGGSRVTQNSTTLAFLHGIFGQIVFAILVTLWVATSASWNATPHAVADPANLRRRSNVTLLLIFAQIAAGAHVRHFGSIAAVGFHIVLALAVAAHVVLLCVVIPRGTKFQGQGRLRSAACWMAVWTVAQLALGITATLLLWPFDGVPRPVDGVQALTRLAHQGVAALLLASGTVLALRCGRLLGAAEAPNRATATQFSRALAEAGA